MDRAKILVVDDTPVNLEILSQLLMPEYRVTVAINGFEAMELAASNAPPDLILLDIMMPDINGYQVCAALKENRDTSQIPIIFVTAEAEARSEQKGLELGAVDYITKPFNPSIVLARVKTHLALHNRTQLLRQLVRKRTADLKKARDEAEAANKAKSAFLANISHELRTPLNGILGMTALLLETNPSEEQKDFLEDTRAASSRLLAMVNDLLDLASAEAGMIRLTPCDFNLRKSLTPIVSDYRKLATAKGLDFHSSFGEGIPKTLHADIGRIRQVVMNQLNNALRFTDQGSVSFEVVSVGNGTHESASSDKVNLTFTVRDTGMGISRKLQGRIFEPFVIGEDFMTKGHSGAGLGLAISKQLVTLMGGHIWLESNRENDTTFSFTVPCKRCGDG